MNYQTLGHLNDILKNLQNDAITIGFTIGGLMLVIYAILVMFDHNAGGKAINERWGEIRKVILCVVLIAGVGGLITFSRSLGTGLGA